MHPKDLTTVFLSCHPLSSQHLKNDLHKLFSKLNTILLYEVPQRGKYYPMNLWELLNLDILYINI